MYKKFLLWAIVASIFMDDFIVGGNYAGDRKMSAFDIYYYYFIFLLIIFYFMSQKKSIKFYPGYFLKYVVILFTASLIGGLIFSLLKFSMLKQMLGILFSAAAYHCALEIANYDLEKIFQRYLKLAFWVAVIGVAQEGMHMAGMHGYFDNVKRMSNGFYRIYSIMGEPYFLAVALVPALYYYLNTMFGKRSIRKWTMNNMLSFGTILLCYIFTFSTGGIIGLALMSILLFLNWAQRRVVFLAPIAAIVLIKVVADMDISLMEIKVRITDTMKAFGSKGTMKKEDIADLNSSSFALYSNYLVAQTSFQRSPVFGCGLGNHEHVSNDVFEELLGKEFIIRFGNFNAKDANSLAIRVMSESGSLGLLLLLIALFGPFVWIKGIDNRNTVMLTIINQAVFIMFVVRIVRTGNYISQGFMLFIFLYVYTKIQIKARLADELEASHAGSENPLVVQ